MKLFLGMIGVAIAHNDMWRKWLEGSLQDESGFYLGFCLEQKFLTYMTRGSLTHSFKSVSSALY